MKLAKLIEFMRDHLKAVKLGSIAVLVLLALADILLVVSAEGHTSNLVQHSTFERIEHFPAFWSVFGFIGCVLIIIVSKWFGHAGIMVREDYYEQPAAENAHQGHAEKDDGRNAKNGSDVAPVAANHGHPVKEHHD